MGAQHCASCDCGGITCQPGCYCNSCLCFEYIPEDDGEPERSRAQDLADIQAMNLPDYDGDTGLYADA